jgi:prepilin peptidase CpaA
MMSNDPIALFLVVLLTAAVIDIRSHRIPNWLVFPTAAASIGYHTYTNGLAGFFFSVGGLGLGILLLIFFYLAGGMGAGDVKLMGAVGSFLGAKTVLAAFCFTALIGGIYAMILIIRAGRAKEIVKRFGFMLKMLFTTQKFLYVPPQNIDNMPVLCYGIAIALGTVLAILSKLVVAA